MALTHAKLDIQGGVLFVVLQDKERASDAEWAALMVDFGAAGRRKGFGRVYGMVVSDGGAPTVTQRANLRETLGGSSFTGSVLSKSVLVRGAVTAMSWFNPGLKVFGPDRYAEWLKSVPLQQEELGVLKETVAKLSETVRCATIAEVKLTER